MSGIKTVRIVSPGGSGEVRRAMSLQDKMADARQRREALLGNPPEPANLTTKANPAAAPVASEPDEDDTRSHVFPLVLTVFLVVTLATTAWIARPGTSRVATPLAEATTLDLQTSVAAVVLPSDTIIPLVRPKPDTAITFRSPLTRLPEARPDAELILLPALAPARDAPDATLRVAGRTTPTTQAVSSEVSPRPRPARTSGAIPPTPLPTPATDRGPEAISPDTNLPFAIVSVAQPHASPSSLLTIRPPGASNPPMRMTEGARATALPLPDAVPGQADLVPALIELANSASVAEDAPLPLLTEPLIPIIFHAPHRTSNDQIDIYRTAAAQAGFDLGETHRQPISIRNSNIRFYHSADRDAAARLADATGAELRDFTSFRPSPPPGMIEFWASGRSDVVGTPAKEEPVGILEGIRRDLEILRSDLGSLLSGNQN